MSSGETPYRFENTDGYSVLVLQPELNESQWADFEKVGNDMIERLHAMKSPAFLVDLTPLSYMGSAMVALIVRLWKTVKERNGRMVVVNQHEMVFEVLKLAGLHNVWTIVDSREQGLKQLGRKASAAPSQGGGSLLLGIVGALGAVAGLALIFAKIDFGQPKIPMGVALGFGALGILGGAMIAAKEQGGRQKLGIGIVVLSVAALILGFVMSDSGAGSQPTGAPPSSGANGESSTGASSSGQSSGLKLGRKSKKDDGEQPSAPASGAAADASDTAKNAPDAKSGDAATDNGKKPDVPASGEGDKASGDSEKTVPPKGLKLNKGD